MLIELLSEVELEFGRKRLLSFNSSIRIFDSTLQGFEGEADRRPNPDHVCCHVESQVRVSQDRLQLLRDGVTQRKEILR